MHLAQPIEKVDKYLVHKEFDDDILIYNGRNAIPTYLGNELLHSSALTEEEVARLRQYYVPCPVVADRFVLRGISAFIQEDCLQCELCETDTLALLGEHYTRVENGYLLHAEYINEIDEGIIARAFAGKCEQLGETERMVIARILDSVPDLVRPMVYYASMFNDTKNYFFYRKHHEHVPGIMLMEVARQAMYAHFYHCRNHRREDVSLSIDSFKMDYLNFTESNYPVRIRVEDIPYTAEEPGDGKGERSIQRGGSRATFYQRNKPVAVATISATLIKINLFNRLRRVSPDQNHRFFPIKNFGKLALASDRQGKKLEGKLMNLSMKGFKLTFPAGHALREGEAMDLSFFVEGIGFINCTAQLRWQAEIQGRLEAGFNIMDIEPTSVSRLKDVIKNFTYVDQQREQI